MVVKKDLSYNEKLLKKLPADAQKWKNYVCIGPKGNIKIDGTCNSALERICARCSIPRITMHDIRHTYATILKENDINLKSISACMGQYEVKITEDVYINIKEPIYDCLKKNGSFIAEIIPVEKHTGNSY